VCCTIQPHNGRTTVSKSTLSLSRHLSALPVNLASTTSLCKHCLFCSLVQIDELAGLRGPKCLSPSGTRNNGTYLYLSLSETRLCSSEVSSRHPGIGLRHGSGLDSPVSALQKRWTSQSRRLSQTSLRDHLLRRSRINLRLSSTGHGEAKPEHCSA